MKNRSNAKTSCHRQAGARDAITSLRGKARELCRDAEIAADDVVRRLLSLSRIIPQS